MQAVVVAVCTAAAGDVPIDRRLSVSAGLALDGAVGSNDPGVVDRLAVSLSHGDIIAALYGKSRSRRLVALEISGRFWDPWPIFPYLASFMGTRSREVSSRAAASLAMGIRTLSSRLPGDSENISGRAAQLARQLIQVASNVLLAPDIRASALKVVGRLDELSGLDTQVPLNLLEDDEWAVRAASLALLDVPLKDDQILRVAAMSVGDSIPVLRGQSAGLLCENALAHGVKVPSSDLVHLLEGLIKEAPDGEVLAPMMGCLARFEPGARADLLDSLSRHPDTRVTELWDELARY